MRFEFAAVALSLTFALPARAQAVVPTYTIE